jgi:hypothetical protein
MVMQAKYLSYKELGKALGCRYSFADIDDFIYTILKRNQPISWIVSEQKAAIKKVEIVESLPTARFKSEVGWNIDRLSKYQAKTENLSGFYLIFEGVTIGVLVADSRVIST